MRLSVTIAEALPAFQQHRRSEVETWSREHARELRVVRELCNWYRVKYGLVLTFDDVTYELIRRYCAYRQQFDTPSAFNRRRTGLCMFFDWAVKQGYLRSNPVDGVQVMKRQRMRRGKRIQA